MLTVFQMKKCLENACAFDCITVDLLLDKYDDLSCGTCCFIACEDGCARDIREDWVC